MIEKQSINNREVWVRVESYHLGRANPNIIPTEYFTASYYLDDPNSESKNGSNINDDEGKITLFESPVAALSFTRKGLESILQIFWNDFLYR